MAKNNKNSNSGSQKSGGFKLHTIIFAAMFAASVIPVGVSSYLNYEGAKQQLAAAADENLKKQGFAGAELLNSWIDSNLSALKFMAVSQEAVAMDPVRGSDYVKKLQKTAPWFYAFFIINPEGMQIAKSDDKLNNVADRYYFKQGMLGKSDYQISVSKTTNKPAFLPAAPLYDEEKKIVGVFGGGADMDSISAQITGRKIGATGYSFLVGADNTVLAHPDTKKIGKPADEDVAKLDKTGTSALFTDPESKKVVKRVAAPAGNGLKLVSQIELAEVEAPLNEIKDSAIRFLALAIVLSAIIAFTLASGISRAIKNLSALSDSLSLAQSEEEIDKIAYGIERVGGAREVRDLGGSLSRLAQSIKLALSALK